MLSPKIFAKNIFLAKQLTRNLFLWVKSDAWCNHFSEIFCFESVQNFLALIYIVFNSNNFKMPLVNVRWSGQQFPVDVNTELEPLVFKSQLFELTGVVPERQKVVVKVGFNLKLFLMFR